MRHNVEERCGEPLRASERESEQDEAHLRDGRKGDHAAQLALEQSLQRADDRASRRQRRQHPRQEHFAERRAVWKHLEQETRHQVDRSLGSCRRKEERNQRRAVRIGAGQPYMQREHCGLDAQSHHDERKARLHRGVLIQSGQPRRHVGHVERASCGIEEADADHVERCADRPEDQVVEGSRQRAPVASLAGCDERIGSDRRDFEEHERVEGVARVNDASEASLAKQEACLEQRVLFRTDFRD